MYQSLECLTLRKVRLSDSKNLLTVWTRQAGRLTLAVSAGREREAVRRRAIMDRPLSIFEGECDIKPARRFHTMREVRPAEGSPAFDTNPAKHLSACFLAEALDLLLRRSDPDETLSAFIFDSVRAFSYMSAPRQIANFHILFLYKLMVFAGIGPDTDGYAPGDVFDLREGRFRHTPPMHPDFLDAREAAMVGILERVNYRSARVLAFDSYDRNRILDRILQYYAIHLTPLTALTSLDVLRAM